MKKCKYVERLLDEKNARFWKQRRKFKNKNLTRLIILVMLAQQTIY